MKPIRYEMKTVSCKRGLRFDICDESGAMSFNLNKDLPYVRTSLPVTLEATVWMKQIYGEQRIVITQP